MSDCEGNHPEFRHLLKLMTGKDDFLIFAYDCEAVVSLAGTTSQSLESSVVP